MWPFRKRDTRRELDERLERYALEELPQRLGLAPGSRKPAVRQFEQGRASLVRLVELEGYGKLVLRVFPRKRHLRTPQGCRRLHECLAAHDIPTPQLLFVDDSPATRRAYGFWAMAEECVEGRSVVELAPEARVAPLMHLADVLVRLHAIRHPDAGRPWEHELRDTPKWARRECALWVKRLEASELGLSRERGRALARWFPEQFRALSRDDYPLTHGDLNGHNLLVRNDGELCVVDFGRSAHWLPQFDLIIAEHWVEELAPGHTAEFLDRYFRGAAGGPALPRIEYEKTRAFFFAWFYLDCTAGLVRRARRQEARGEPSEATREEARRFWGLTQRFLTEAAAP